MTQRKEPTIGASSAPSSRPTTAAQAKPQAQPQQPNPAKKAPAPSRPAASSRPAAPLATAKTPIALWGVVILLIAGFAYAGFQIITMQKQLAQYSTRIVDLESQLMMTGDETEASSAAIQAKLKWADSEIRKLWGVSYDRNKKSIEQNASSLKTLQGRLAKIDKGLDKKIASASSRSASKNTSEIAVLNELVSANRAQAARAEKEAKQARTQVKTVQKKMDNLGARDSGLTKRVLANEEAIDSLDAFRRTVNQRLLTQ